ncbi:hypothetical protein JHL17_07880 [Azospirillum sp. YIM B02556]|uniref:Uncharacterized protein n=1 Tax=Azospirillum endophyticum TaxID=2800326 RepID=A0ABS1F1P7_9PROT|nr:hypothetical protein [Azospirillum endophyticum]MBK1837330.1 hypothetical protein [Azospirillum endophyticum]
MPTSHPTRRAILAGTASACLQLAALALLVATPHPDAELLAAWNDYVSAHRAHDQAFADNPDGSDEDFEPYWEVIDGHAARIRRLQALTLKGFAVQLRFLFAARVEYRSSFRAAIYGEPADAEMIEELETDWRDEMLWRMADTATNACRIPILTSAA